MQRLRRGAEARSEKRHLKPAEEIARLFKGFEPALRRTVEIADRCTFSLDELAYEYPDEPVPPGKTPQEHIETLAWDGASWRYPDGVPEGVKKAINLVRLKKPNVLLSDASTLFSISYIEIN